MMELSGVRIEHDPEKWEPVFGQDHAQTNWWLIFARNSDLAEEFFSACRVALFGQARHPKAFEEAFLLGYERGVGRTCRRP